MQKYFHKQKFFLESGDYLPAYELAYTTFGTLNKTKDNVVWICHALTANANPCEWWDGLVGSGKVFDTDKYFIVCANMLGSCYGSTNALSINPETNVPYYHDFPLLTNRDIANSFDCLRAYLDLPRIKVLVGGSMGGQQAMEWAIAQADIFENLVLLATNARHSSWAIAFNESQRMAITADQTWQEKNEKAGLEGLKAARAIALLSYRNYHTYNNTQVEEDNDKLDDYRASSYQQYQGEKLQNRFHAFAYWTLSKAMDTHHVGRNRRGLKSTLAQIKARTLVIGIKTDFLFPPSEQQLLADGIPDSYFEVIESSYGHDGFLIENNKIGKLITSIILKKQ